LDGGFVLSAIIQLPACDLDLSVTLIAVPLVAFPIQDIVTGNSLQYYWQQLATSLLFVSVLTDIKDTGKIIDIIVS